MDYIIYPGLLLNVKRRKYRNALTLKRTFTCCLCESVSVTAAQRFVDVICAVVKRAFCHRRRPSSSSYKYPCRRKFPALWIYWHIKGRRCLLLLCSYLVGVFRTSPHRGQSASAPSPHCRVDQILGVIGTELRINI